MKLRLTALMLTICMLMFCGCSTAKKGGNNVSSNHEDTASKDTAANVKTTISIACSITDSFCPYIAKTRINREAAQLLYAPLVSLDNSFKAEYVLASDINISGKSMTVTLKTARFTDGTYLSADDVVYCAQKAMSTSTRYKENLRNIASVSAVSTDKVLFTLKKSDPFAENELDFPIYKANSDLKISSDNISIPPIGCGKYYINDKKTQLKVNNYYVGKTPSVKTIELVNTPDNDSLTHNLEVGNISYYYSNLSDCSLPQVRGKYALVNLNNLVYLGVNMTSGLMKESNMRRAVSAAVDRKKLCEVAYYGNAAEATGIYNPNWYEDAVSVQNIQKNADLNVCVAQLSEIGYNKKDNKGFYVNSNGDRLTLKLVCYKDNEWRLNAAELVKSQLQAVGIKVNIEKLDWAAYKYALNNKQFDLYIAEVELNPDMDISELVTKGGDMAYGIGYSDNPPANSTETQSTVSYAGNVSQDSTSTAAESTYTNSENTDTGSSSVPSASSVTSVTAEDKAKATKKAEAAIAGSTARAVSDFYYDKGSLAEIITAFNTEMPIVPLLYRTGIVGYSSGISGIKPSQSDIFHGIETAQLK